MMKSVGGTALLPPRNPRSVHKRPLLRKLNTMFSMRKSMSIALPPADPQSHCHLPKLQELLLEDNKELEHVIGHQNLMEVKLECPSLEKLVVRGCPKMSIHQLQSASLAKPLKEISVDHIHVLEERMRLQRREEDDHLKTLELLDLAENTWSGLTPNTDICFSSLKRVRLSRCKRLKQAFTTSTSLEKLEELLVEDCDELEQVIIMVGHQIPEQNGHEITVVDDQIEEEDRNAHAELITRTGFKNLRIIKVSGCGKLKTVFPILMPLPKLQELYLETNVELKNVFEDLNLGCTSKWPFLTKLSIAGCPKMSTQFVGIIKSQLQAPSVMKTLEEIRLHDIHGVEELMLLQPQGDKESVTCNLRVLSMENLVEVQCIWRCPSPNIFFASLYRVNVIGCKKLKHLFETSVAQSLPQLKELIVQGCSELEQVMVIVGQEVTAGVIFENLKTIKVSKCEKLKTIFPISIHLPKLESLQLENNAELEHVFGQSATLSFSCWPSLKSLSAKGCPKISPKLVLLLQATSAEN